MTKAQKPVPAPQNTDLHFSQVREDPQLELHLLEELAERRGRPLKALVVGSGGCTALSLLSSDVVERVDAVDINPAQTHLIELRKAAVRELDLDEQKQLIGECEGAADEERRQALFDAIAGALPEDSRAYWDARRDHIAYGVNRVGTFDRMVAEVGEAFEEVGIDPLVQPARALGHDRWLEIFNGVFDVARVRELIGSAMTHYSTTYTWAQHFSAAFAEALRKFAGEDNYFLHHIFRQRYDAAGGVLPPYLLEESQQAIKDGGVERLTVHTGNFHGKLLELSLQKGPYDLIQTSDISDWMPVREVHKLMTAIAMSLAEGGAVLSRRLCGDHSLAKIMGAKLNIDTALSGELLKKDRSFLYSEIVVGFAPTAA